MRSQPFTMCAHFQWISDRATQKIIKDWIEIVRSSIGIWGYGKNQMIISLVSQKTRKRRERDRLSQNTLVLQCVHTERRRKLFSFSETNPFPPRSRKIALSTFHTDIHDEQQQPGTVKEWSFAAWRRGGKIIPSENDLMRRSSCECECEKSEKNILEIFYFWTHSGPATAADKNIGNLVSRLSRVFDVFLSFFFPHAAANMFKAQQILNPKRIFRFLFAVVLINVRTNFSYFFFFEFSSSIRHTMLATIGNCCNVQLEKTKEEEEERRREKKEVKQLMNNREKNEG